MGGTPTLSNMKTIMFRLLYMLSMELFYVVGGVQMFDGKWNFKKINRRQMYRRWGRGQVDDYLSTNL